MSRLSRDKCVGFLLVLFILISVSLFLSDRTSVTINNTLDNARKKFGFSETREKTNSDDTIPQNIESVEFSSPLNSSSSLVSSYASQSSGNQEHIHSEGNFRLENATFYTLCQNEDLNEMVESVRSVEEKFNKDYHYDWVFLNDKEFTDEFVNAIRTEASGKVQFGVIPKEIWDYPDFIDLNRAAKTRGYMKKKKIIYGDLESYHHMCRFQSGYYFTHPLMMQYKYSWRVEPGIKILCYQNSDPFKTMREKDLIYGFNISPRELPRTIHGLWKTVKKFISTGDNKKYINPNNLEKFITTSIMKHYNTCHFWTNFEITNMDWLRAEAYVNFFNYLDRAGGFYYERWGDAPIRSIALSLFASKDKIHFFNEIGYYHAPLGHCPYYQDQLGLKCECEASDGVFSEEVFDWHANSCLRKYFKAKGLPFKDQNPKRIMKKD